MTRLLISALIDGNWVPQGGPVSDREFFSLNPDLPSAVHLRIGLLEQGDSAIFNLGSHGTIRVERV